MSLTKEEWKKIGKEKGWDTIYTGNGYDAPIKTAQIEEDFEYDDDYSPENDLMDNEKTGDQFGELSENEIDLGNLFHDPLSKEELDRLDSILNEYPELSISVDYHIAIDEAEPENNYPRQITDITLTPYIEEPNLDSESKYFLFNLIKNSLAIKQQIAKRYGDYDYAE